MPVIKDALHGNTRLSEFELSLIDTPEMQRLRGVRQVAMAHLVYPGANHTRFEHSIGTLHLAGELAANLDLGKRETQLLRCAALLHDVGHPAFSHESEPVLERHLGRRHEEVGLEKIRKGALGEMLEEEGFPLREFADVFMGNGIGRLVTFELGADRMDYLLRDSHYTGVAYGVIDADRLIHTISMQGNEVLLDRGGLEAAESLLIARFLMFSTVYYHHTVRIASAMLNKAIEYGIADGVIGAKDVADSTDAELLRRLEGSERADPLVHRLKERRLFKRVLEFSISQLKPKARKRLERRGEIGRLEAEIAEEAGVSEERIVVDYPPNYNPMRGDGVRVPLGGKRWRLTELSEIVKAIEKSEESRRRIIVAAPREDVPKVKKKVLELFRSLSVSRKLF